MRNLWVVADNQGLSGRGLHARPRTTWKTLLPKGEIRMPACTNPGARVCLLLVAIALCASAPTRPAEARTEAELFQLANGMRWIAAPMEAPGEVTVVFYVATGTAHESPEARGAVATLVELWRLGAPEV